MSALSIFAPAKLNLFLAITGRRADGFHDLVSVAAPVEFGDTLRVAAAADGVLALTCDDPAVPVDESNLVLKAARAFAVATGWRGGAVFSLEKRIPMGAGLGGGSSDAVAALRALNELTGGALGPERMAEVAATLGSDCPLFLQGVPVVMRGRGERVERLAPGAAARLKGRRVLIFKPAFGISTPWAYGRMAADGAANYLPGPRAEAWVAAWVADPAAPAEKLLLNAMEGVAFEKFVALPALLGELHRRFGVSARMSGSGSACFALLADDQPVADIVAAIKAAWGESAFVTETRIT
ncbi:MAG: 4-(cytidine 5'-diphospho)-2-C-methyl-D-erythritol kinase [Verrucomicrobia bacterium]|nr:4-(cytidine 5'-diphospho)-2-C-methyl-D-erythritol kinase [Verrucomicrobiota bacterium]